MPSDVLLKYWTMDLGDEEPQLVGVYYMTTNEIAERDALNVANTASAQRQRVVEYEASKNGHSRYPT